MRKNVAFFLIVILLTAVSASIASAAGEDVLAKTGQYTFFMRPDPCAPITYYQKMVPCVVKQTISVPRRVFRTFQVPVPAPQKVPVVVTETPIGCAQGAGPCATCFPAPSTRPDTREVWGPKMITVRVPDVEFMPKEITRQVTLPQWFAVTEQCKPPQKVRKVRTGG